MTDRQPPKRTVPRKPAKAAPAQAAPVKRAPAKAPVKRPPAKREPEPPAKPRLPSGFSTIRDLLLFIAGLAIIVNEVFIAGKIDPTAVGIGVALTGAPLVFGADERKAK